MRFWIARQARDDGDIHSSRDCHVSRIPGLMANDAPATPPASLAVVDTMRPLPRGVRSFRSSLPNSAAGRASDRTSPVGGRRMAAGEPSIQQIRLRMGWRDAVGIPDRGCANGHATATEYELEGCIFARFRGRGDVNRVCDALWNA
jgi:hypothetical protein